MGLLIAIPAIYLAGKNFYNRIYHVSTGYEVGKGRQVLTSQRQVSGNPRTAEEGRNPSSVSLAANVHSGDGPQGEQFLSSNVNEAG